MRGMFRDQGGLFSYVSPELRVPPGPPLRKIRGLMRDVLAELSRSFARLYAREGRPSVPPEQLLSALLIQVLYGIRSERQLMEQLNYNLLFRWFVGLSPDDLVWDPTTFTKDRERLQTSEVFEKFMTRLLNHPQVKPLLSDEHFSVDGTLIEAWASQRSFRPKDGSDEDGSNFHGQTRKNDTHQSTTDPDSRLYRKAAGREAKLSYMGHVTLARPSGAPPRRCWRSDASSPAVVSRWARTRPTTRPIMRRSAIDGRTTRHTGYAKSQSRRAMIECIFGWGKQHGTLRKTKHRGIRRVAGDFLLNLIAYNLVRIPKLVSA